MNQAEVKRRQAQAISAILSFITLTVVARLTGYNGVTYVAVGMEAYVFLYVIVAGGLADALGRVLRLRNNKGQYKNAVRMRRNALLLQLGLGAAGTLVLLAGAEKIAEKLFRVQYSTFIIMIFAPALLLRSISETFLGYTRGNGAELPGAAAGLLRQIFILGFSAFFSKMMGNYGDKVSNLLVQENFSSMYSGVGVAIAITLTEAFVALFLFLIYRGTKRMENRTVQDGMRTMDSFMDSVRILEGNRGPQLGIRLLMLLTVPVGFLFFQKASENSGQAAVEYGVYLAGYCVVCGICAALVLIFIFPICGKTMSLLRKEESRFARSVFQSGVHMGLIHTAFLVVFFSVMANETAAVLCPEQAAICAKMLRGGASVLLFAALSFYFARILILTGKKYLVLGTLAIADVIYIIAVTVLLNTGKAGILALVYSGMVGSAVAFGILGMLAYRQMRLKIDWLQVLIVPVAVACVAGLVSFLLGKVFTPHLGNFVTLIVCLVIATALYWGGLILLRNFNEQELENIPGGKLIFALGQMLRVF